MIHPAIHRLITSCITFVKICSLSHKRRAAAFLVFSVSINGLVKEDLEKVHLNKTCPSDICCMKELNVQSIFQP